MCVGPVEGEGQGEGGFSPLTFLEILKSYWEKGVFSPPLWVTSQPPPTSKVAPRALVSVCVCVFEQLQEV